MTFEYALLAVAALQFVLIAMDVTYTYATRGFGYGFSSNRAPVERGAFGRRIENAYRNQVEANAYAVPVLAAAAIIGLASPMASLAVLVHVGCRLAFALAYYTGIPFIRVPFWVAGWMSVAVIGYEAFAAATA